LSVRDVFLLTVSALIALNRPDLLHTHLLDAPGQGVSEAALVEAILRFSAYVGWPGAQTAAALALAHALY
jgi:4-carboxymuconolactone decarboxylase